MSASKSQNTTKPVKKLAGRAKILVARHLSGRGALPVILAVTLLAGLYVIWHLDTAPRTDDAYVYADTINLAPEVSGRIIELAVRDNQSVAAGDVLFRIDPRPFKETLAKAEAAYKSLEKEIDLAQKMVDAQVFTAEAAAANVVLATAAMEQARLTLSRLEPLLKDGFAAREQVDQARTALKLAESQEAAAIFAARSASSAVSNVEALVAKLDVLRAEIALAELELEFATVRAPFDGKVLGLRTTAGEFAAAGHPVFTLAKTDEWFILANFRETDLGAVKAGAKARVYLMSDTGKKFSATVDSVGFGVHPDDGGLMLNGLPTVRRSINWVRVAQRFPVKFRVEDPDPDLFRIGASAVVVITGPPPEEK